MAGPTLLRRLLALLAALLLTVGLASCSSDSDDASSAANGAAIGVDAFSERVEAADVVLDVRTPAEYAEGHLPDAVNIDIESGEFTSRIAELDPDATYAVYCRSGNRSAVAIDHMVEAGFTDVQHLAGGIVDWQGSGGPVVTD